MKRTSVNKNLSVTLVAAAMLFGCAQQKSQEASLDRAPASFGDNSSQSIVEGQPVEAADPIAASTVQVLVTNGSGFSGYCTGTLISRNLVLTAAHCLETQEFIFIRKLAPKEMAIGFGLMSDGSAPITTRQVIGGVYHRFYDQIDDSDIDSKNNGDVAVLRFSGTLPAGYKPAKVVFDVARLEKDAKVVLAGYGALGMLPRPQAAKQLMKVEVRLTNPTFSETEVFFAQNNGGGACHGDSGGPAYLFQKNGDPVVFGVTSRAATATGGRTCLEGSVYTHTASKRKFILASAGALFSKSFVANSKFSIITEAQENSIR